MTEFVIDTSIIITYLFNEPYVAHATAFLKQDQAHQFFVPEFCLVECTNVIWKRIRFQGLSTADGVVTMRILQALPLKRSPIKTMLPQALRVAVQYQLAVYDAVYIAMAMQRNSLLVTLDQKQAAAASAEGLTTIPITNF